MSTPYRNDDHALRERKATLEAEIAALRDQAKALASIEEREKTLAKELAAIDAKIGGQRRALPLLDNITVASPCNASWDDMVGDDRTRFCLKCEKNVFNLSAMTRDDAEALLREKSGGRMCIRYYQRKDGTILTADCPVGASKKRRRKLALAAASAGAVALAAATVASRASRSSCPTPTMGGFGPTTSEVRMGDWGPGPDTTAVTGVAPVPEAPPAVSGGIDLPARPPTK